jgi:hypothetical protein
MQINAQKSILSSHPMDKVETTCYEDIFLSNMLPFNEGIKYLGFHLKSNNYRKEDWCWLITKLEKSLKAWSFRWLSREGRLVLVKSVLEAIIVYWMSLAWIPKGTLEKVRHTCFRFLLDGSKDHFVKPRVKWESLDAPKLLEG